MKTIAKIHWDCPKCLATMHDEIDEELGPFNDCVCDKCGDIFAQDDIPGLVYEEF